MKHSLPPITLSTPFFYRTPKIDEWFHAAAVWNRDERKTYLYLNGQEIGSDKSNTIPKNFPATTCDIGLKRVSNDTTRGYLKNLMIVGAALTSEEISNMTGKATFLTSPIQVIAQVWEHLGVLKFQEWSRYVYTMKVRFPHKLSCFKKVRFVRNNVSILATYLSPNPTLTLTCYQLTLVGFSCEGQTLVTSAYKTITVVKRFRFSSVTLFWN